MRWIAYGCVLLAAVGCGPTPGTATGGSSGSDGSTGTDGGPLTHTTTVFCGGRDKLDLLIVMDDSDTMIGAGETIGANLGAFIDVLEHPSLQTQYRIAVTTTSVSTPGCEGWRTEDGRFDTRACTEHLEDYVPWWEPYTDGGACTSKCGIDQLDLGPTTTHLDDTERPRPWIEVFAHANNLPAGVSARDALTCIGQQGINGCPLDSPLQALTLALQHTRDPDRPEYGFFRPEAVAAVLFITDGHDCSVRPEHSDIFAPEGTRVFWSDPLAEAATPAACWNAGVICAGGPGVYDECHGQAHGPDGAPTDEPGVLEDVESFIQALEELEAEKKARFPDAEVLVSVVAPTPVLRRVRGRSAAWHPRPAAGLHGPRAGGGVARPGGPGHRALCGRSEWPRAPDGGALVLVVPVEPRGHGSGSLGQPGHGVHRRRHQPAGVAAPRPPGAPR